MNTVNLSSLVSTPAGRSIAYNLSDLEEGDYALIPDKTGKTRILRKTPSKGTDFYKYLHTANIPFEKISKSGLLPSYTVELNASPIGSDSQEYENALVFSV